MTYPVIRLSFGEGVVKSGDELKERITELLRHHQHRLGIVCDVVSNAGSFLELIQKCHQKFGQRVVAL